MELVSK